jgi:protein phosphatase 1 regulatory subunit 10
LLPFAGVEILISKMPRIDPQQLLTCLKPLLAPQGGIKSQSEVQRIASLMEKYSKKLVSKCIYIQILKNTGAELLGQFMSLGGWSLVHQWLNDGNESKNWPFVIEILEMFLLCPVDSARLKSNKTPIIVKDLADNSPNTTVNLLAAKLVDQWLKIARQEQQKLQENKPPQNGLNGVVGSNNHIVNNKVIIKKDNSDVKQATEEVKYKISNKDTNGKLLLSLKRSTSPSSEVTDAKIAKIEFKDEINTEIKEDSSSSEKKSKSKDEKRDKKSSSSHSSSHKSSSKSSHKDKERSSSHKSSGSTSSSSSRDKHHKSSSSKSSSSSSRDKSKDKEKERERRKKEEKEKAEKAQAEKDKETLNFLQPLPSAKLQKIPKRQHSENSGSKSPDSVTSKPPSEPIEKKKPSMSIEVRTGDKPKTVKTLNSQFRDHGLAAEAPKPPSRKDIKKPGSTPSLIIASAFAPQNNKPVTATSPTTAAPISPPPSLKKIQLEKALENEVPERVGGVKLIKPKRKYQQKYTKSFLISLQAYLLI